MKENVDNTSPLDESSLAVATDIIEDDNMEASASMFEAGARDAET